MSCVQVSLHAKPGPTMPVRARETVQIRERLAGLRITYGPGVVIPKLDEHVADDLIGSRVVSPVEAAPGATVKSSLDDQDRDGRLGSKREAGV